MIFPLISDGDFALSEFGDLEGVIFGMMFLLLLLSLIIVIGRADGIRRAHIDKPSVFA